GLRLGRDAAAPAPEPGTRQDDRHGDARPGHDPVRQAHAAPGQGAARPRDRARGRRRDRGGPRGGGGVIPGKMVPLVVKQVVRHRARTLLTVAGIAIAMFLFTAVQAMHAGTAAATRRTADDTTLVVYRQDRFCPATSVLPQDYESRIERIEGVVSAMPIQVVVSNCRTSLDVVTFRGVPKEDFLAERPSIEVIDGS